MLSEILFDELIHQTYAGFVERAALGGSWGVARLANVDNSNVNLIVVGCHTYSNSNEYRFGLVDDVADLDTVSDVMHFATGQQNVGQARLTSNVNVAAASPTEFMRKATDITYSTFHQGVEGTIVVPGKSLEIFPDSAGASCNVSLVWIEVKR